MTDPTLSHCTAGDVRELAELYLAAFAEAPLRQVMYRGLTHEAVVQRLEKSFAKTVAAQSDTSSRQTHFLKITEPKTNEIMAVIIWIYLPNGYKPAEDPQTQVSEIPAGGNEQLIRDIAVKTAELRSENSGRHEGHWQSFEEYYADNTRTPVCSLLGTHPKFERRGAGSKLVRWVFDRADAEGKRCYVDGSASGHKVYQRCGFDDVGEMTVNLEEYEPGCGFEVQIWKAMVREPKSLE